MATSSSTDYSITAREVIDFALKKTNLLARGQTANGDIAADAMTELNLMLKGWLKHDSIWRLTEASLTPTASTASISMTSTNPYRVVDARFRGTDGYDIPMMELTRTEYYDIPNKTATGTPTQWYFDPQRATSTLYIWPVLSSVTTQTIRVTYQRRHEDIDDLANDIDVPQDHLEVVGYNLAARLADSFGKRGPHVDRIIARAESLLNEVLDADRPEVIRFVPERR